MTVSFGPRSLLGVVIGLAAVGLAPTIARAQVTYDSQLRTIAVSVPLGGSQSASAPPGDFSPFTTSVSQGFSPATNTVSIQSFLQPTGVFLLSNVDCQTAGAPPSIPAAVLQHQAIFTLASPQSYILTAGDTLPTGANVGLSTTLTGPGGVTIFSGRSTPATGLTGNLPAGTYTFSTVMQISVAGGALGPATGTLSANINFGPVVDTATAILYQGRLTESGAPANGQYDMTFQVFNAPTGGTALTGVISVPRVQVTNGVFSTPVNIPPSVWNAGRSYIECAVGFPVTFPTVLSPRQPVQPAPKALWALLADGVAWSGITGIPEAVANPPWSIVSGDIAYTGGRVGIGVSPPAALLHVRAGSSGVAPLGSSLAVFEGTNGGYLNLLAGNGSELGILFGRPIGTAAGAGIIYNNPDTPGGLQFRTDNNVTRLSIASNGASTFTGSVTAPDLVYTTPVTSYLMLTDADFRSRGGSPVRGVSLGGGGAGLDAGTNDSLVAPVQLPHNATIVSMRLYFVDNTGSSNLQFSLLRYFPTGSFVQLATFASSGSGPAGQFVDVPVNAVVDNFNGGLVLAANGTGGIWDQNLLVRGVRFTYTMPRPVP